MKEAVAWAQIVATVAIVLTFLVYWRQLVAMQSQVAAARDSSRTQNLISLIDYIHRPEHRQARQVLTNLAAKSLDSWTTQERLDAERACSAWDAVALVLRNTSIPQAKEMIVGNWRYSILSCYSAAQELMRELHTQRDPEFWDDFEWLAMAAQLVVPADIPEAARP